MLCGGVAAAWVAVTFGSHDAGPKCYASEQQCRYETIRILNSREPKLRSEWKCVLMQFQMWKPITAEDLEIK